MKISAFVRNLLLLSVIASPAFLRAQFQEPTPEELKMTSDPKAPGAAAEYLYREEICNDEIRICSYYERIKVLTEKGKELAAVRIPRGLGFVNDREIQGRTIHSDGTIVPLAFKPDDIMDLKTRFINENSIVFNLPSVEVGSILEYRFSSKYFWANTWWIQQPYFVRKEHFSFTPRIVFNQLLYTVSLPPDAKVVKLDRTYTLDITDVPPQPDEDWMPPLNTLMWNVDFYYTEYNSAKKFWAEATKNWANQIKDITNPSGHLKKDVAEIIAPGDTDLQKAVKIYDVLQKFDNTDFSREKTRSERKQEKLKEIKSVEDVWNQKSGSGDDIALLYAAMARAVGLKAWPMQVVDRNRAIFDNNYMSLRQLDDFLVDVVIDGKDVFLDPGQKMCPFGSLSWKHSLATGLQLAEKGAGVVTTPVLTYKESVIKQAADLNIDETGDVKGTVRVVMTGPEALYWRQLALENDETEVKKQFIESMRDDLPEGVQADFDHFLGLDDSSVNLIGLVNLSGTLGSVTGKHFFLPGLFLESRAKHPFVAQDKRVTPIDLHFPKMTQDYVVYHLPSGYTVESAPQTSDVTWPNHAILRIGSVAKDSTVNIQRTFVRNFTLLDPKEYNELHDFYLKVAVADQQQLVLAASPTVKGN
jgi:hypothetical protein